MTPRGRLTRAALALPAVAGLTLTGCYRRSAAGPARATAAEPPGAPASALLARPPASGDSGLVLEAFAERPLVTGAEPMRVTFLLRNHGAPRRVRFDPGLRLHFVVLRPSGRELRLDWASEAPLYPDSVVNLTVPSGGFVGQSVNLRCAAPWWSARPYGRPGDRVGEHCVWGYEIREAGEYRVVAFYLAERPDGEGAQMLASDTVRVTYRPE